MGQYIALENLMPIAILLLILLLFISVKICVVCLYPCTKAENSALRLKKELNCLTSNPSFTQEI